MKAKPLALAFSPLTPITKHNKEIMFPLFSNNKITLNSLPYSNMRHFSRFFDSIVNFSSSCLRFMFSLMSLLFSSSADLSYCWRTASCSLASSSSIRSIITSLLLDYSIKLRGLQPDYTMEDLIQRLYEFSHFLKFIVS